MRNIRLTIEYDGSRFQGWQRLGAGESTANTISGKLCEVLSRMTGQFPELFCASRTETGVHAYAQTVNFHTDCTLHTTEIRHYLNRYLPSDIAVLDVQEVPERFHASLNAKGGLIVTVFPLQTYQMYLNVNMSIICLKTRCGNDASSGPTFDRKT